MSCPHAIATGDAVIAAALAMEDANMAWGAAAMRCAPDDDEAALACEQAEHDYFAAVDRFDGAVSAHRAATAVEHTQGPDMDADGFKCPSLIAGGRSDRCGLFSWPPRCKPSACSMKDQT